MPSTNGHGPKRAILYARVSTDEQARSGYSLAQQMEALREYATREGYEVFEEVVDPGQSGASLQRPGMDQVRDLVAAGGVSVVLAQDRDRFSREPAYTYLLRREFEEQGCTLKSLNDRGDDSPEGELMDGVFDQFAKFERAKTAERSRRGKIAKAKQGKIIAKHTPNYGFRFNEGRDNYVVDEVTMSVVRRIFRMVGVESRSIHAVKRALDEDGVPVPSGKSGKRSWDTQFVRHVVLNDIYKPYSHTEIAGLVSPDVAAKLGKENNYGVWWFNREHIARHRVVKNGESGREYKYRTTRVPRPRSEWIAVPVPDAGVPREWVEAAREAIKNNRRPSDAGRRFWELSGRVVFCGTCGRAMTTRTTKGAKERRKLYYYYACIPKDREACSNCKKFRAEELESSVWEIVSALLTDPVQLRKDLERMIEQERQGSRGDPDREAQAWLEKLSEVARMRGNYQEMTAKGFMTFEELEEKFEELEETRVVAERELVALKGRQEFVKQLERDRDALLESYAGMAPTALGSLSPEERHRVYKMLKLRVEAFPDRTYRMSGVIGGGINTCKSEASPHVSVHAHDLDESVRFYKDLFGMEETPTPGFPFSVRWLRVGELQLHLFQSENSAPQGHHFGIEVDDFEATYEKVGEMGAQIEEGYFSNIYELPDGAVQLYVRDPAGNMVEVNWPDVSTLDRSVIGDIEKVAVGDEGATLYLGER